MRSANLRQLIGGGIVALLIALFFAGLHFTRNYREGVLSPDGLDMVQSARYLAAHGSRNTQLIRPLLTGYLRPAPDGTLPDLAHAPLYPAILSVALRLAHHTTFGLGDKLATLLSLVCWVLGAVVTFFLFRQMFGPRGAILASSVYLLSGSAALLALAAHPATMATVVFALLLMALYRLDVTGDETRQPSLALAGLAGALYGLLYLGVYSVLALLPVLLWHVWRVSRRDVRAPILFLVVGLVVASPQLIFAFRQTHNPFFNSRLLEVVMQTDTNPGYSLYRSADLPLPIINYIASGGLRDVIEKAGTNFSGYATQAPTTLGGLVFPLLLVSSLMRFADGRVNRLRGFIYIALLCHFLGLSLFGTYIEGVPLLLLYAPFTAVLAVAFLQAVLKARNLPRLQVRSVWLGWSLLACLPGLLQVFAVPRPASNLLSAYFYLNTNSPEMRPIRDSQVGMVASEVPWEIAFRCAVPTVWLPRESSDFRAVEARMNKPILGVILTPTLMRDYAGDATSLPYRQTYQRVVSVWGVGEVLSVTERAKLIDNVPLYYPQELSSALTGYIPNPYPEPTTGDYTLMFWSPQLQASIKASAP